jgi:hypothetical protein
MGFSSKGELMLTLLADQPECLWEDALPIEVKALPEDLAAVDVLLADHELPVRQGAIAEHRVHGRAQRLGSVDHDPHALLDIEAAIDEVCQQHGTDRLVLS